MRTRRTVGVLLLSLLIAASCSDDDDDESTAATAPAATAAATTAAASGGDQVAAGCALDEEIDAAFSAAPFPESEEPTPEQIQEVRDYMTAEVSPLMDRAEALEIPEIQEEIQTAIAPIQAFIDTGDAAVLMAEPTPEEAAAETRLNKFFYDNCDNAKLDVTATDYAFSAPASGTTLPVGTQRVRLTNDGKEMHEMVVFTKADGVTESFDELLALPEEEAGEKVTFVSAIGFAAPGEEVYGLLSIKEPGDYVAVCFVPVGATDPEKAETLDAPPHFSQGMKTEFTVA